MMITHYRSHHAFIIGGSGGSGGSFRARPEAEPTEPTEAIYIHDIIIIINSLVARLAGSVLKVVEVSGHVPRRKPFQCGDGPFASTCLDL